MIRTRFAPSPTGYLHIGGVRTALFSWLYARKHNGRFILRIEDTDQARSTEESVNAILEGMAWLGLDYDEGPFYQTRRFNRYQAVIQQLLDEGNAYYCYCSRERLESLRQTQMAKKQKPRYDGHCHHRKTRAQYGIRPVVRFKNPQIGEVLVKDLIKGVVRFNNNELDDLIIARSDGTPTYNLTVVVDDWDMKITHVIRGDDHLNNTPRQINILKALGGTLPEYAHLPMILGSDGQRLSKRHGAVNVINYKEAGYLPQAMLNYLVRLGWSYGDQEIFSRREMLDLFDIKDVNSKAAAFDNEKLLWLDQHYIKTSDPKKVVGQLKYQFKKLAVDISQGPDLIDIVKFHAERSKTLQEMAEKSRLFFTESVDYEEKAVNKNLKITVLEPLKSLHDELATLKVWESEAIHQVIHQVAEKYQLKLGKVAQPLRVAVTGNTVSPPIDATLYLIGQARSLHRIQQALTLIQERSA